MNKKIAYTAAVGFVLMALAVVSFGQNSRFVISAEAGGINLVEGRAEVNRADGSTGSLIMGDSLKIGDRVTTFEGAKAEILLNPGSYIRLGSNSSFEFRTTSLDDLNLQLNKGVAVLEVFANNDFLVNLHTPVGGFVLSQSGIYQIEASDEAATLSVFSGRAHVIGQEGQNFGRGREATILGENVTVARFNRSDRDELAQWSRARGRELARSVNSLQRDEMRSSLLNSFNGGSWDMYNSFGLWVFDPFSRSFAFLPFGYGWYSPYGVGYGRYIGWYGLPRFIYYPNPTIIGGGGTNRPAPPAGQPADNSERRVRNTVPPFVRIQGGSSATETRGGGRVTPPASFPAETRTVSPPLAPAAPPAAAPSINPAKRPD